MPDLPSIAGGPNEVSSVPASTSGVAITNSGSANTKGSYTELIASTAYDSDWLLVTIGGPTGTNARWAIDIAQGASTAEQILIPNILYTTTLTTTTVDRNYLFPLRIPRGTRLSARCQANGASSTIDVAVRPIATPIDAPIGFGRVEAVGVVTSGATAPTTLSDPGATANVDGTWTQLIAATGFAYKWICLTCSNLSDTAIGVLTSYLVDIAIGAAGSEVEVISDLNTQASSINDVPAMAQVCIPLNIPSGVRIAARHRCSVTTTGDRRLDVALWGCG